MLNVAIEISSSPLQKPLMIDYKKEVKELIKPIECSDVLVQCQ